jgi:hypothetical protein
VDVRPRDIILGSCECELAKRVNSLLPIIIYADDVGTLGRREYCPYVREWILKLDPHRDSQIDMTCHNAIAELHKLHCWLVPSCFSFPLSHPYSHSHLHSHLCLPLADTYLAVSASALAATTVIRSIVGAAFPLFATQMFHNLTPRWASTVLGFIALVLAPTPTVLIRYVCYQFLRFFCVCE